MSKHAKAGGLLWRSTSFLLAVLVSCSCWGQHVRTCTNMYELRWHQQLDYKLHTQTNLTSTKRIKKKWKQNHRAKGIKRAKPFKLATLAKHLIIARPSKIHPDPSAKDGQSAWWYADGWSVACSKTPAPPSSRPLRPRSESACWASLGPLLKSAKGP